MSPICHEPKSTSHSTRAPHIFRAKKGDAVVVTAGQIYYHNASGERKATGSYFTPSFAVEHLLDRALDPTLREHLARISDLVSKGDEAGAAEGFFDFRVADIAMGSGHFLVAAVDHIEAGMAAFLAEHHLASIVDELRRLEGTARDELGDAQADYEIEGSALLRRQIARRCIYGIDLNPIAVELARVAMWIHTFVPGLPMSSLDHTLVCANSLTGIGTIDEAIESLEPERKAGMPSLFSLEIEEALVEARQVLVDAANASEATKAEVRQAARAAAEAARKAAPTRQLFDAAVAYRTGILDRDLSLGTSEMRSMAVNPEVQRELRAISPGHMPALFPEVMTRERPGFDVIVGNPPWEKLLIEELRWWAQRVPGLWAVPKSRRAESIEALRGDRPDMMLEFESEVARNARMRSIVLSGPYKGLGSGHVDLHQAFSWRSWQLVRSGGRLGLVLPRGSLSGSGTTEWRREVVEEGSFADVCFLANISNWVFDMDNRKTFALVCVQRGNPGSIRFCGPFTSRSSYIKGQSELAELGVDEFRSWSDSLAFPVVPSRYSIEVMRVMIQGERFGATSDFEFRPVQGDLNTTTHKHLFGFDLDEPAGDLPVLGGSSFNSWNPDARPPYAFGDSDEIGDYLLQRYKASTSRRASPFFGMEDAEDVSGLPFSQARIAFRGITNRTNRRTVIASLIPPGSVTVHSAPYLLRRKGTNEDEAYLLGVMSSIPFDWYARRWVEQNLTFELLRLLPIPIASKTDRLRQRIVHLSARLAATDERFRTWAESLGVGTGTVQDDSDRWAAQVEIDAAVAYLYGLSESQLDHIYRSFHPGWEYSEDLEAVLNHFRQWTAAT